MFVQAKNPDLNSGQMSTNNLNPQSFIDPATYMSNGEFVFRIPPEAPVFEPTVEEFLDPLAYINKIRPVAEKTGICKVKPPPEWHPPFAVDVDHFKFTPRIQKLNELDANTRVKLYFLDRLATYWNYSGVQIRIPAIDDKTVDMYSLYKLVELEGGFEKINVEKKWNKVAQRMGYLNDKAVGPQLRTHYKRWLLPYEKFEKSKLLQETEVNKIDKNESEKQEKVTVKTEPGYQESSIKPCGSNGRRCTRSNCDDNDTEILVSDTFKNPIIKDKSKELQRLTFYGPGPKILGSKKAKPNPEPKMKDVTVTTNSNGITTTASTSATANTANDPIDLLADSACMVCGNGESEESILLCDGCDDGYHTFCLIPPLTSVPKGEWRCPKCIAAVVSKATDTTFGFEQAEREYSLQQFGEMADQFKSNYFNMPVHLVPTEKVEQEYWKILSSMDSNVTVEYGADLHSMDHGSGFPTHLALKESGDENHYYKSYVESSWNLNNIPVLEGSVLGYINADISGMKIPWMYVGMCFSTFCWHNEDHWSYSINYLHWGEPKTWYGVPGFMAERFEQVMQETTPDLFRNQPDLLHQLVTILNPNILMDRGVPVYHIDQAAGEFVLTFPRAYHAGFNHGYNFAEAVNFAPVDWIPLGRECVEHYSSLHRYCVFSHDELICKMASVPENLNSRLALATHQDMLKMLDIENKQRKALLEWGVVNAEREAFELLADDERKCAECNTTCFLSAVTCKCSPKKVTCLRHFKDHCTCPPVEHTLRYRYTLDELPIMLDKLKEKADSVATWAAKVHDALNINTPRTITLSGLKELLNEAQEKHFPDDLSLSMLSKAIKAVQKALVVDFKNILSHKHTFRKKVTITEIRNYYEELLQIPCVLPQENMVKHFLKFLEEFEENAQKTLKNENATLNEVESLLRQGNFPNVEIPCLEALKSYKKVLLLVQEYHIKRKNGTIALTLDAVEHFIVECQSISPPNAQVTNISRELVALKEKMLVWEKKAKVCWNEIIHSNGSKAPVNKLQKLFDEAKTLEAAPPSHEKLRSLLLKTSAWKDRANHLLAQRKTAPFVEQLERVIEDAKNINIELEELPKLKVAASKVISWREEVHRIFLGDCHAISLLEVLMPRRHIQRICRYKKNSDDLKPSLVSKDFVDDFLGSIDLNSKENINTDKVIASLKVAEKREFELMRTLRVKNTYKKKQGDGTFCLCDSSSAAYMKECILCKDLFHEQCLKSLINYWEDRKQNSRIFLCPFCQRTKRPNAKYVQSMIAKLQKLQLRSLEGIAMQCLLEREAKWKESVYELLKTPELSLLSRATSEQKSKNCKNNVPVTLSSENRNSLESLLFRGFLLELDIPENEIIYKILHKLDANTDLYQNANSTSRLANQTVNFDQSIVDMELTNESYSLENELSTSLLPPTKDRKRKNSTFIENNENDEVQAMRNQMEKSRNLSMEKAKKSGGGQNAERTAPRKRTRTPNYSPRKVAVIEIKPNSTLNTNALELEVNRLITVEEEKSKHGTEVEEEEETECEAKMCLKPTGEHLDWVQCDYCKNWLHMICIGVTKGEVDDQTEFMCSLCKNVDSPQSKNDENEDDDDDIVFVEFASKNAAICSS